MSNANELYIYIDESGSMDFHKNERYFVVCAMVVNKESGNSIGKVVKDMIYKKSKTHKINELHGSQMSIEDKVEFFDYMKLQKYNLRYLVLDKYSIHQDVFKNTNACFKSKLFSQIFYTN